MIIINSEILKEERLMKILEYSLTGISGTAYDISRIVHYLYKDEYICGKIKSRIWYHFDNHKWRDIETGPYREISTNIVKLYYLYKEYIENSYKDLKDKETELNDKNERIDEIITKLKSVSFKENVCRECLYLFHDQDFLQTLDRKVNLICFNNGVWDIGENEFRDGRKEDYISLSIGMDFKNDDNLDEILDKFKLYRRRILSKRSPKNIFQI